jgi:hypothetical protein
MVKRRPEKLRASSIASRKIQVEPAKFLLYGLAPSFTSE